MRGARILPPVTALGSHSTPMPHAQVGVAAARMARGTAPEPARPRARRRGIAAPPQLRRNRQGAAEPRHGRAPRRCARHAAARAQRAAGRRRLRAADTRKPRLATPELAQVRRAIEFILAQQEPYPAFVLNRHWDVLMANDAAMRVNGFVMRGRASAHRTCSGRSSTRTTCARRSRTGKRSPAT